MMWTSDFRKCHWKVKNAGCEVACSGNACVAMLYDMLAKCRLLSYGCRTRLQWENVHTCPKSAPQKTQQTGQRIASRCADSHPVCCPMSAMAMALRWAVGSGE